MGGNSVGIAEVTDWLLRIQMKSDELETAADLIIDRMESLISSLEHGGLDDSKSQAQAEYATGIRVELTELRDKISKLLD